MFNTIVKGPGMKKNADEISVNILDILLVLLKWKKVMIINIVVFVVAAIAYALLAEQQFTATTVIVPKEDPLDMVSGVMKNISLSKLQGNLFSPASELENLYLAILRSGKLESEVIQKFDLVKVYKMDKGKKIYREDVAKALEKHIKFGLNDEGTLFIQVTDCSPQRAADMANFMAATLDEIYKDLSIETARNRRISLKNDWMRSKRIWSFRKIHWRDFKLKMVWWILTSRQKCRLRWAHCPKPGLRPPSWT